MSLVPVYQKLLKLASTDSTNKKVELLEEYLQDKKFLNVVKYALSGDKQYHIKVLPKFQKTILTKNSEKIFKLLRILAKQTGATNSDKVLLAKYASIDSGTYEVVKRIVNKDLKCGVSAKLVNKARPGTVNTMPYMRCSTDKKLKNIVYPAIIQEKADGMFVNLMIDKKGRIKIITRNGKTVHQLILLKEIIRRGRGLPNKKSRSGKVDITTHYGILNSGRFKDKFLSRVYTGELLVRKNGKILPRKTGNGILNSCLHGTADQEDADCVIFKCWDTLPLKAFYEGFHPVVYNTRVFETSSFVAAVNDPEYVEIVMTQRVDNYEDAHEFYGKIREAGGEGAILKNYDGVWKDHTSPNQVKMKNVSEAELEIVGWEPGKEGSKYELCMGSIKCRSKEGGLTVSVGSGFSDEDREQDWDGTTGKIVTIEFESVIQDKRSIEHNSGKGNTTDRSRKTKKSKTSNKRTDKGTYSLFLPRFKEIREDRSEADTLEEILKR